jgi:hypothetical protein
MAVATASTPATTSAAVHLTSSLAAPCSSVAFAAVPFPPPNPGSLYSITATAAGCPNPLFEFWVLTPGSSTWQLAQAYSSNPKIQVATIAQLAGTYQYSIWARDASSVGSFGDALGRWDAYLSIGYPLSALDCEVINASATPQSSSPVGTMVTVSADAHNLNCIAPLLQFWILAPGSSVWRVVQAYSLRPTFSWNTGGWAPGVYGIAVWVRDGSSLGFESSAYGRWDSFTAFQYTLTTTPCQSVTASAVPPAPSHEGTAVTITGNASGCPNPLYEFWLLAPGSMNWQLAQPYSTNPALRWSTADPPGQYRFSVWAHDSSSPGTSANVLGRWDAYTALQYTLTQLPFTPCASTTVLSLQPPSMAPSGTTVAMTFGAFNCSNPLYELWMQPPASSTWQLVRAYDANGTFNWNTMGRPAGTYSFRLLARDASSPGSYSSALGRWDAYANFGYTLTTTPCVSVSESADTLSPTPADLTVAFTGLASGCPNALYEFWMLAPGSTRWQLVQAFSTNATFGWDTTGTGPGVYEVMVWARDASSTGTAGDSAGSWDSYTTIPFGVT